MIKLLDKNDPILRQIAVAVPEAEFNSPWLKQLISDLFIVMEENGAVGVAAPQIGISKRVIVFGSSYSKRRKPEHVIPNTALINPSFTLLSDEKYLDYEGCLNCDDVMGEVPRALDIEYSGFDVEGNKITRIATGLEARIIQHEIDHLNGVLFIDRVGDGALTTRAVLTGEE